MEFCFSNGKTEACGTLGTLDAETVDVDMKTKTVYIESPVSSVELMMINT